MNDPDKPEDLPAHDSLFGQAAAETAPAATAGPVLDHEPAKPSPSMAEKKVVRRGGTPLLLTLLVTAALGGGIYWTWSHPKSQEVAAASDPDSQAKFQSLSDRLDKLEKTPAPTQGADADLPAKLQALADRLDKLEKASAPAPDTVAAAAPASPDATIELSKKLDDLNGQLSGLSARQDQLAAGLSKMQEVAAQKPADISTPPPDHSAQDIASAAAIQAQQQLADLGGKTNYALTQQKSSLESLEQRLGRLEQTEQTAASAAQAQSSAQVTALDTRLGKLEQTEQTDLSAAQAQSGAQVKELDTRVGKLEQSAGQLQGATKDATLAVRLEAAQAALAAGKPLGDVPDAPPALQRFATAPPPTQAALRAQFPDVSAAILAASRPEEAQRTFLSRALARVEQSVTVRQGDHVIVGDPAAGLVARAQAAMANDDLAGAVNALAGLTGRAAEAAKSWREQAQALLAARAALLSMASHG